MVGNRQTQKKRHYLKKGKLLSSIPFQSHWESNRKKTYGVLKPSGKLGGGTLARNPGKSDTTCRWVLTLTNGKNYCSDFEQQFPRFMDINLWSEWKKMYVKKFYMLINGINCRSDFEQRLPPFFGNKFICYWVKKVAK